MPVHGSSDVIPLQRANTVTVLHGFGYPSKSRVSAVVYAVAEQDGGITEGIVCSKSRLSRKYLTIPRLELVAGHMAANLVINVEAVRKLTGFI